jgi:hypothetical protein
MSVVGLLHSYIEFILVKLYELNQNSRYYTNSFGLVLTCSLVIIANRFVMKLSLFSLLYSAATLVRAAPLDLIDPSILFPDTPDWILRFPMDCPIWKGPLPSGTQESKCTPINSKTFTRTNTYMKVNFHLSNEIWQEDPRRAQVLAEIESGINKGLDLFATHAGTQQKPLLIHITMVLNLFHHDVLVDSDNGQQVSPCYIVTNFPTENSPPPLLKIKKDIVKNMYSCVQQYHHPGLAPSQGTDWWRLGLARFFDGVAWPATAAMMRFDSYPEEYIGAVPLYQHDEEGALFWHSVHNSGWSLQRITNWMKGHAVKTTTEAERANMAGDSELTGVFHNFGKAAVDKSIRYPGGSLNMAAVSYPDRVYDTVALDVGRVYTKSFAQDSWKFNRLEFPFGAGQTLDIWMDEVPAGFEWSYRKKGTQTWTRGVNGQAFRLVTPANAPATYEFVTSRTSPEPASYPRLNAKRI